MMGLQAVRGDWSFMISPRCTKMELEGACHADLTSRTCLACFILLLPGLERW